jgi:hypothetical protein
MANRKIGSIILEGATTIEDTIITGNSNGSGKQRVIAEGTLQDMDVENRNRRIYAKSDLAPEVNGPRMKELISNREFKGECGHPLSDDLVRQQTIDPKLVCVLFNKVWIEGNRIKAQFQGTNNAYGDEFNADLLDGCKPAFSLRALGSIENVGGKAYVKGIKIITWDRVIYPSHKVAYTERIVSESAIDGTPVHENQVIVRPDDPGTIINLSESDARTVISRLQRESASLDTILNTFEGIMDNVGLVNEHTIFLTSRFGEKIYVNLENHIDNLIMDYASRN